MINFDTTHSPVVVDIVSDGFDGYVWGGNTGWIHFKSSTPDYNIKATLESAIEDWSILK